MHNKKPLFASKLPLAAAITAAVMATPAIAVDFHGYARAGASTNIGSGGEQTCFGNGASGHYVGRLADECDTYAELSLGDELFSQDGKTFRIDSMLAYSAEPQGNDYQALNGGNNISGIDFANEEVTRNNADPFGGGEIALRQLYVSAKNVVESLPGATLWAGKRFYQRKDIHQMDLFYVNNSGYGAGIENIKAGAGHLSVAYTNADTSDGDGLVQNNKVDVRYAFPVAGGHTLELIGIYAMADLTDQQKDAGIEDENGYFLTAELSSGVMGGFNKFAVQYGADSMGFANAEGSSGGRVDNGNVAGYFESSWRVLNHGVIKLGNNWDLGHSVVYEKAKPHDAGARDGERLSIIARPIYNWSTVMSTAIEIGYSDTDRPWFTESQDLGKVAIAQQWQAGPGYWARPVIRAYAATFFGDEAEAARGGEGIDGDIQIGAQIEAWW
ncbi:maltoporin LamB [Marinobacter shengliensis]|uniref:maltoporin LamB n=1 Tax=Marinobacter shengliensis TaxID=1389223 RepID=UPI000D0F4527|nr:maltoporin LamB [Marinobacter shengliensis]PSF11057.1 maltoporin precursor [Marinobacter shengliensis]